MPPTNALTLPQKLALIDAWPCPVRAARDLDCPACGYAELGQTLMSELPALLYCRRCGWARTEPLSWLWGSAAKAQRDPLEALAYVAVRSRIAATRLVRQAFAEQRGEARL